MKKKQPSPTYRTCKVLYTCLVEGGGVLLRRTREVVKRNIALLGIGKVKRPEENIHTLLKGMKDYEKVRLRMVGGSGMPARAAPLREAGEGEIVEVLVEELKENFGVMRTSTRTGL